MSAIESLLAGLIDYAGLFPPASLDMRRAVENYLAYKRGRRAHALGRFVVDVARMEELVAAAGENIRDLGLSVILAPNSELSVISRLREDGIRVEAIETRAKGPGDVEQSLPADFEIYAEPPDIVVKPEVAARIASAGRFAKLRMGGVVAEAFPPSQAVAETLEALARHRVAFKATAGLHHPIRSFHPFTYSHDSRAGMMHGFVNLACASALIHFGGEAGEAAELLEEQKTTEFRITPQAIGWRAHNWSSWHLTETRKEFFRSFGSCSFEEPMRDLEELGWL